MKTGNLKIKDKEIFITTDKIFSHLDTLYKWRNDIDVYPITVEMHLTERCNNKCWYCNYPNTQQSMSLKDFKIAIKKLSQIKTKAIILSGGGEPTLHPDLSDAIKTIAAKGMDSAIITNLLLGNKKLYTTILENCSWCRISLDASRADIYKKIRGHNGFRQVIKNIKKLVGLKKRLKSQTTIGVQSVVNEYNCSDVYDEIKMTASLSVDYIQIRPVETLPHERLIYSKPQYDRIMEQIGAGHKFEKNGFKVIRSNKWDIINPYLKKRNHGFSFCHAFMMFSAIDARGDMYVCCHQIENRNKKLLYGNIIEEPIGAIMSRRKKIIKNLNLAKCYLECRGSNINRRLEGLKSPAPHSNFL